MPVRRHEPVIIIPRSKKYASYHDYGIDDSINRADYLSNAVLEDTYEAANRSRGKDYALLRDAKAAIRPSSSSRDSTPTRTGRSTKRFRSLPPVDVKATSSCRAVVPYKSGDKIKSSFSSSPTPTSLLSSRINAYLRGSSLPPHSAASNTSSNVTYKSLLPRHTPDDLRSHVSYKSFLSDPSVSSPFTTRSSTKFYPSYQSPSYSSSYRPTASYLPKVSSSSYDDDDYVASDDDDYDPDTSYTRKYKIIRSPAGSAYGSGVRRIGQSVPAITYPSSGSPEGSDAEEDYYESSDRYGTYTCPRPSGTSPLQLSSYDGDYDGSYEADMAPMYDYVPFGPSRQGILELTSHGEESHRPSSSSYLTSPSYTSASRLSPPPPSSSVSLVPSYSTVLDDPVKPSNSLLESLVSTTAARAKKVLEDSKLPDYKNASLVLSVEGSAVSEDGKNRYGFRYYPPPIPLKGSHIGLDERILGVTPKSVSPADSFLSKYLNKLRDIRTEIRDHVDRGDYARGRSVAPYRSSTPSYSHHTVHMPVTIAGRAHSVPVSSYRSRLGDGQSHRVDVFPLVESETTLPSDRRLQLPLYRAGGEGSASPNKLTVLEKINIKAAIIGSRLEGDAGKRLRRPRSEYAANKLREMKRDELEEGVYYRTPSTGSLHSSRPPLPRFAQRSAGYRPGPRTVGRSIGPRPRIVAPPPVRVVPAPRKVVHTPHKRFRLQRPLPPPIYVPPVRLSSPPLPPLPPVKTAPPKPLERPKTPSISSMGGSSVKIPAYYAAGGDPDNRPVSDLRRRLRRTIAKAKNNPDYYRE